MLLAGKWETPPINRETPLQWGHLLGKTVTPTLLPSSTVLTSGTCSPDLRPAVVGAAGWETPHLTGGAPTGHERHVVGVLTRVAPVYRV